ncbi:MAG: acyl-CoA dehydrogenase family protein [Chloroflexi bacterium]|nr:acyl-CoA dehydrogenase family protein [Chloroflexota bacterium]
MDFRFGPEDEAFREEIRAFARAELPAGWGAQAFNDREDTPAELSPVSRAFQRKLADKGWLTLAWPKEYGGLGAGPMQQLVYNEEMSALRAPAFPGIGVAMVGPTLMLHGTDEQRGRFLTSIARNEMSWCQGFSEPGAGSDLASLQTRAVQDGDDFIVNGQKIWTSNAHRADYCILLARTDPDAPKHRGISYFLMDMKSPGISIRPLTNMLGSDHFNELFMDNVRIPRPNLIGELNRGWYVATTTLDFERSGIQRIVFAETLLHDLIAYARDRREGAGRLIDRPGVRNRLADLQIEFNVGRLLSYRVAWMQGQGQVPNSEASVAKLYSTELQLRFAVAAMNLLGVSGVLARGSAHAAFGGRFESYYLAAFSYTIAAGTSEVQRNIIAQRGLGLPRD